MKKSLIYIFIFCAIQATLGLAGQLAMNIWFPERQIDSSPTALMVISATCSVLALALFLGLKWCPVSRNYVRSRPWLALFWTALLGLGVMIPLTFLTESLPESWQTDVLGAQLAEILKRPEGYFVVCMLAPLAEEVIFRGAVIRSLQEWTGRIMADRSPAARQWTAITLSALFFALVHMNPAQMPYAFLVGLLLGWLFARTGSIVPGVILHWVNNSAAYVIQHMFPLMPYDAKLADYFAGNQTAVYQAVGFSLLIALPAIYQLNRILKTR